MPSFRFFHMKMLKIKNDRNRESDKGETAVSANLPRSVILGPARLPQDTAVPSSEIFDMLFEEKNVHFARIFGTRFTTDSE